MAYTNGVSSGPSPYDIQQYQKLLAAQQASTSASSTTASASDAASTFSTGSTVGTTTSAPPPGLTGLSGMLSGQLSSMLLQLQTAGTTTAASGAGASASSISKTDFEKAFDGGQNTTEADQVFGKLDKNGDGTIDQSEAQSAAQHAHGHGHHHHGGGSSGGDPLASNNDNADSSSQTTDPLAQLLGTDATSTDGTGTVSKSDFEKAFAGGQDTTKADAFFSRIDKNGDGSIDQSEAQNALKHAQHARDARAQQSPFGISSNSSGQGGSSSGTLNNAAALFFAQLQGQAA